MQTITNIEARNAIVSRIMATPARRQFRSDWSKAKYLARGEAIVGVVGGFANSIIFSPAGARDAGDYDRFLFFGANGVLVHEEVAVSASELRALIAA